MRKIVSFLDKYINSVWSLLLYIIVTIGLVDLAILVVKSLLQLLGVI